MRISVQRFLDTSREPALLEPGEAPISLAPGRHAMEDRRGALVIQAWDESRNIVRRVVGVLSQRPGRLDLETERFGKRRGKLTIFDQSHPRAGAASQQGRRHAFRERFRLFVRRQFPGWKLAGLTTEADLEHTLSPVYPRAFIRRGAAGWAVLGAPPEPDAGLGALTFGLIWLDYLRRREPRVAVQGLSLFLPEGQQPVTCLRLQCLDPRAAQFAVCVYSPDGHEEEIDPRDFGNLVTSLPPCRAESAEQLAPAGIAREVARLSATESVVCENGSVSFRVRGLEFARAQDGELTYGLHRKRRATERDLREIRSLAVALSRMRCHCAADRGNPIYKAAPEAWLESQVRAHPEVIAADLARTPIYGQTPALTGVERGVIDLLAVTASGRLAVIELKASADPHLPLQALDYWMRVRHHAGDGGFARGGYFPGLTLSALPPRLLLVAPALEFHATTETLIRFFQPEILVERIGVGMDWRRSLEVVFRAEGARKPGM